MSNAINQAIQINLGEPAKAQDAKRELFEAVAYEHYLERRTVSSDPGEPMTQDEFCRKTQTEPGRYFYERLESAWWGFQAGFTAAALAGAATPRGAS